MKFDIIGDIHGHADKLTELLEKLGYFDSNGIYQCANNARKAIFVGDYIDRGPKIRDTLSIVKSMVDNDAAYAVIGNHEYNALCYHTKKDGNLDSWLRPHTEKNKQQHLETLRQFKNHQREWENYLYWFMKLPLFLDLGDVRIVHAAWISLQINKIRKWTSDNLNLTEELLLRTAEYESEEFEAIEAVLKGVEILLPEGQYFKDKDKNPRKAIRIRWWEKAINKTYGEMVFPRAPLKCGKELIPTEGAAKLSAYNDDVPVFFGHYWRNPDRHGLRIQADRICCLDYSVARGCLLVAYCWQGEKTLRNNHLVWV